VAKINRRTVIKGIVAGGAVIGASSAFSALAMNIETDSKTSSLKGNINHSVCRWCFGDLDLDTLCIEAKKLGLTGIDLVGPKDWPVLKKHGLTSSMCNGAEINLVDGFNDPKFHDKLIENYSKLIPQVEAAGYKNLICFSGNRRGIDDETGWKNCVSGLKKLLPLAVKHNVYQCDNSAWGVELCKRVGSENFKLLYDIYHMQVDEGNVISTIKKNHQYFAHYHTAGVPGRNEIDESQELYYPAIMKAIVATGFKGFVAQEFIPKNVDKLASLKKAISICDV
jgi:hydroxypyruvate isomerase